MTTYCDWHGCRETATRTVRKDVQRGEGFFTLVWHRCEGHTPINPDACVMYAPSATLERAS